MKHNKALVFLCASLAFAASACGGGASRSGKTLYVCVYDGGYGTEWLSAISENFEKDTGIHVDFKADATVLDRMDNELKSNPAYDIYMSHDINWRQYAQRDQLEPLDDVYSSQIDIGSGQKTFEQRLVSGAAELSKGKNSADEEHYYKVCWTQGAGGLIYNVDMFEANHWTIPTTYEELGTLCQTIIAANIPLASGRGHVTPIGWAGKDRQYYWDYPVFEWWAQLAGLDKVNTVKKYLGPDGSKEKGYEMYNPDTYYKEFIEAYGMWYDLIALNKNYSLSGSDGADLAKIQSAFINGEVAMIPYAHWAKFELQKAAGGALPFNIAMMETPKVNATAQKVNYNVGFGDSMIVPSKIADDSKEMAKEFIKYLAKPESSRLFVEKSQGAFLAFDYSDVQLGSLTSDTYISSVYKKITESTNFNIVSTNPIAYQIANTVMPWIENVYYYAPAFNKPADYTPAIVGNTVYNAAVKGWPVWLRQIG